MKTTFLTLVTLASFAALLGTASPARADHDHDFDCNPIEDRAAHVQSHSLELYREVQIHVGYQSAGRHLLSDVADLYRTAARIRSYAHAGVNLSAICREGQRLDRMVHHIEEMIDDLDHGHSHHGHAHHGHDEFKHLRKLVRVIEDDTHELVDEIEALERHLAHRPVYHSRPGLSVGPGGLHLGGHGISVKFGK